MDVQEVCTWIFSEINFELFFTFRLHYTGLHNGGELSVCGYF